MNVKRNPTPGQPILKPAATEPAKPAEAPPQPTEPKPIERGESGLPKGSESFFGILSDGTKVEPRKSLLEPKPEEKPPEAKPAEAPETKPPEGQAPAAPAPTEPEPPKKVIRKAKGYDLPIDAERLAATTAAATGKEVAKVIAETMKKDAPPEPPAPEMTDDEKKMVATFQVMENMQPDRYKGLGERATKAIADVARRERAFAKTWSTEHAADEFDSEADRNKALEEAWDAERQRIVAEEHQVVWDEDDYNEAKLLSKLAPVLENKDRESRNRIETLERMVKTQQMAPVIEKRAVDSAVGIVQAVMGEAAKAHLFKDNMAVNFQSIKDSDPETGELICNAAQTCYMFTKDATACFEKLADNEAMQRIGPVCEEYEKHMTALSDDKRQVDGKPWIPRADWEKLAKKDQADYATTDAGNVIAFFTGSVEAQVKQIAKANTDRFEQLAKAKGWTRPDAGRSNPAPAAPAPPTPSRRPVSPSVSGAAGMGNPAASEGKPAGNNNPLGSFQSILVRGTS